MEKLEVEVVSRETIKPSSPTPHELLHYKLSFLDQISPPVYNPLVLFYSDDSNTGTKLAAADISTRLKSSLSETLTRYYPLAGRLRDNIEVFCNDEGVAYLETRVRCSLSDVIHTADPMELRKLVPFVLNAHDDACFGIQLNVFECGGVAVGLCISHKMADGLSFLVLTRTWSAICRGDPDVVSPEFMSATLFPPMDVPGIQASTGITAHDVVGKRFVFGPDAIKALKEKYRQKERPPSRVEALSAFIWSRFASSTRLLSRPNKASCFLVHAVNLRNKFEPPLPEHSFGNLYRFVMTLLPPDTEGACQDDTVPRVREKIASIDKGYVEKLRNGAEHLSFIKQGREMYLKGEMVTFNFTSLCRFPLYEADFGWGKPMWVGSPALTFKNLIALMDTKSGDGVEAYIHLTEEDMAKFEKDEELQRFITPSA